jgi:bifunctional UDP-N-acetylglucosamine pyrophosphorylase / glucosamine-1-phosphate N-acetyltransferase
MKSALPKVLHPVCGQPMLAHIIRAAREIEPSQIVVVAGYGGDEVRARTAAPDITFVDQPELLGTADAVRRCREALSGCDQIVVLNGDSPLITGRTIEDLIASREDAPLSFVTCVLEEPGRMGRVLRDSYGRVRDIVEAADYDGDEGDAEINAGQYVFEAEWLWKNIETIPASANGEYYLTLLPRIAHDQQRPARTIEGDPDEVQGVDDRVRLAEVEWLMRQRVLLEHMMNGVTVTDPATTYIDAGVQIAEDVTVLPNCYLYGETRIASNVVIGPGTTLKNAIVGEATRVEASVVEDSALGKRVRVGPFAHVRGGATIGDECELGNYSEVKNSVVGRGVKMHHFSYLGDADVGDGANISAGMITCNFDGVNKHRTVIGAGAFIGCDTMLVAPVTVGDDALTGAGTVVTKDIPAGAKAVGVPARIIGQAKRED